MLAVMQPISRPEATHPDAAILGLDNVRLELPLAGVGSRTLAAVLDSALLVCLLTIWWMAGMVGAAFLELGTGWIFALLGLGSFFLQWGYFAALEIAMDGQTPGKRALDLRVVSAHGGRAGAASLLVRNFVRGIDLLFGLPCIAFDRHSRRLGDLIGGTLVVHERDPAAEDDLRLGRMPEGWSAREASVVEGFLRRAPRLGPGRADELASRLLRWIERSAPGFSEEVIEEVDAEEGTSAEPGALVRLRRALAVEGLA